MTVLRFIAALVTRWTHCMRCLCRLDLKHQELDLWMMDGERWVACTCGQVFYKGPAPLAALRAKLRRRSA